MSLVLEIQNLKSINEIELKELNTIKNELKNRSKEAKVKSELHNVELMNKDECIAALQNSLKSIGLKHESVLLQHKKDFAKKEIEIGILLNNLNYMKKQNNKSANENKQQNTPKERTS